ncbi:MAG TPA: hypothetical protein DDW52_28850 [Planctomycetaceae bacterium]|nr:hypothetical protein [Planctomycetaceae bacterium]
MKIQFACRCGKKFSANRELAGKAIRCSDCGKLVEIPEEDAPQPPTAEAAPARVVRAKVVRPAATKPTNYAEPPKHSLQQGPNLDDLELPDLPEIAEVQQHDEFNPRDAAHVPVSPAAYSRPVVKRKTARKTGGSSRSWLQTGTASTGLILGVLGAVVSLLLIVGLVVVVMQREPSATSSNTDGISITAKPTQQSRAIGELEARELAQRFVAAVNQRDARLCNYLFDTVDLLDTATSDAGFSSRFQSKSVQEFKDKQIWRSLFGPIINSVALNGEYALVGIVQREGEYRAIARLSGDGLNYHEFMFKRNEDNEVRIRDMFIYATGETLGTTLRNTAILSAAVVEPSFVQRMTGESRKMAENAKKLQAIQRLLKTNPGSALPQIRKLPEEIKQLRIVKLWQLMASESDLDAMEQILDDLEADFPGQPNLSMNRLLLASLRDDLEGVRYYAQQLNERIGGDPFLVEIIEGASQ